MKIGFIGLGNMGGHMARRLITGGHELRVFDIRPEAMAPLVGLGAEPATSPRHAAQGAELVMTSLPGPADVLDAVLGEGGAASGMARGAVFADLSTVGPDTARTIAAALEKRGISALDSPVSGGVKGAESGTLAVMVGGDRAAFSRVRPALDSIGDPQKVTYCGPAGSGCVVKLVNNLIGMSVRVVLGEAFTMGVKAGVDAQIMFDVISGSTGNTAAMQQWKDGLLKRNLKPGFALSLGAKDVRLATDLGRQLKVPMALSNYVDQQFMEAVDKGLGTEDGTAIVKLQEQRAGVEIKGGQTTA